ncbi:MAG: condensation domain-containing protein [Candidatus Sphingomonas phytovorans]|nr:condensation domain-containing protein [Sphingomonas sp.]WEJ99149.1 MAG: condensation domain-containing protein [Sphingomonas sp.]
MLTDATRERPDAGEAPGSGALRARVSREQRRLWFLAAKHPEEATYNMAYRLDFKGPLDAARIERAIAMLQDRHETLRTRFIFDGEQPLQVIEEKAPAAFEKVSAPGRTSQERQTAAAQLAAEFAAEQIPLDQAPLFHCRLIRIERDHHALVFVMHHIVGDGWSHSVLTHDFCEAYELLGTGDAGPLAPLSLQFADFAEFQSESASAEQVHFWIDRVAGLPPLDLPIGAPASRRRPARHLSWLAGPADTRLLREFVRSRKMLLSAVLLTAFERALGLMSGQNDFFLGTVVANRRNPDVADMIGFFANTVLLPAHHVLDRPAEMQLADNQSLMIELQDNQEAPLDEVIDGLHLERHEHEDAPIQALFVLQNAPYQGIRISDVTIELERLRVGEAKVPVTLFVTEGIESVEFEIEYDPARVGAAFARDLLALFREELSALAGTGIAEQDRGSRIVSGRVRPENLDRTIVDLIWNQARKQPQAVALSHGEAELTYRELTMRADALATALSIRGIAPQSRIATCLPRGIELYVSLIGIMRAAMIWAPIDPDAPPAYRAAVLDALKPALVIGEEVPAEHETCAFEALTASGREHPAAAFPSLDHTAYAISTSGTSGTPKTVLVGHAGLANISRWVADTLELTAADVGIWKTTMMFDAVCRELFPIMIAGGRLAIAPPDAERDMELLGEHIARHGATTLHCVPTQLRAIIDLRPLPDTVRAVMSGGEPLPTDLAHRLIAEAGIALYNVYGPTEATVDVTCHQVTGTENGTNVPIGVPVDNVRLALTCGERLLPITARGEIAIGGCAVAKGYLGGEGGGFGSLAGLGRSYRTGDLGTFDASGGFHCEGRLDRQIKVNGVRIEPGSIEAALRRHPQVGDAQVAVLDGERSEFVALVFPAEATEQAPDDASGTAGEWQPVFDDSYADLDWSVAPHENTLGWVDSGTRQPIPSREVLAATDDAASKILRWKPRSVLELGCGIGTLAFRLIPNVDAFLGIDFAANAIEYCRHHATRMKSANARFETGDIESFDFGSGQRFDAIILNSVVQYLPDEAALDTLLSRASSLLSEDGYIFLGDIRDARLRDLHAFWKLRRRKGADTPCEDILLAALGETLADEELLLHPDMLARWSQANGFAPPLVEPNCAQGDNELVNFRFSATLCRAVEVDVATMSVSDGELRNAPVAREAALLEAASRARPNQPIFRCLARLPEEPAAGQMPDGASLRTARALVLVTQDPRKLRVHHLDGTTGLAMCAAAFGHRSSDRCDTLPLLPNPGRLDPPRWKHFLSAVGTIHQQLRGQVPLQMLPQRLVPLPYCPRLPSGKRNQGALERAATGGRSAERSEYPEPGSPEARVAAIFQSLLGSPFARDDDFFAMGGNSLIATRARNRLERELSIKLPLRALFEAATPRLLAREIARTQQEAEAGPRKRTQGTVPIISHAQRRLWFIEKLGTSGAVYNIAHAVSLAGQIDLGALDRAVGRLCKRHVTLRSTFYEQDGEPQLRIMPPRSVGNIELIETCRSQDQAIGLLDREQRNRFDLEQGPLLRILALPIGRDETVLCMICHHIVSDGWSMGIALNELAAFYEAERAGEDVVLPELAIDYLDLALHDEQPEQQRKFADQIAYWQDELAGAAPNMDLPFDRVLAKRKSWAGDVVSFDLDAATAARIETLAAQERATPFIVLLSAFHLVLRTFAQQDDTVIGTVLANRNRYESEGLVGFLVNPLPLRVRSEDGDSFRSLCARTREVSLRGFDNQDVPFDVLVEHLPNGRNADSEAFFQVLFALQNNAAAQLRLGGLDATRLSLPPIGAMFDLSLELRPRPEGYRAVLEYSTELFDRETVALVAQLFDHTLQACLARPDVPLHETVSLPEGERRRLLAFGRGEPLAELAGDTICRRVQSIADTEPDRPCLNDGAIRLTFTDVLEQARALAGKLRSAGCGDKDAIAISVSRGASVVVAMLAAQWAGGVPCYIDPAYPEKRQRQLFGLAGCVLMIAGDNRGLRVLDAQGSEHADALDVDTPLCSAYHPAFLAFTSGTTGTPKVVQVSHRAVCARLRANDIALGALTQADIFAHCYSFNYDGGLVCTFWPLTRGTPITFVPLSHLGERNALIACCRDARVTVIDAIPLVIATLIQEPTDLPDVRLVVTGGDSCPTDLHRRLRQALPDADFANQYGPCEGVFNATTAFYPANAPPAESVTIGEPIAGCDIAIVGPTGGLVPTGSYGELWISDPYLADGYLDDPAANAAKFVEADYFDSPQRFLRTGDRARWLKNGEIEFAGRLDRQVQLNGMRVEPDEIEAVLRKLPDVKEAAVLIADEPSSRVLSAFIVPGDPSDDNRTATATREWEDAFDALYRESRSDEETLLDFTGWTRTADGEPIPDNEMRAWLADTIAMLETEQPRRVLEVGSGLGLIALSLAPASQTYVATDISKNAIEVLTAKAAANGISLRAERASAREAAQRFGAERFDLVILNSVAQYLSGYDELSELVADLSRLLSPGGSIFVGDVRDLRKADAFYEAVERSRHPAQSPEDLAERLQRARLHDEEAHFDPGAFSAIAERIGMEAPVVRLKPLAIDNEMVNFRYDVLFRSGQGPATNDDGWTLDWSACDRSAVPKLLCAADGPLTIANVPFADDDRPEAKSQALQSLLSVAEARGWHSALFPSARDPKLCFFAMAERASDPALWRSYDCAAGELGRRSNYPGFSIRIRSLRQTIQASLEASLPAHMVPAVLVFVDELPTKPGGKIDEARLRKLLFSQRARSHESSEDDILLAAMTDVWRAVLEVDVLPPDADFFAFGGHSLLATKLVARIQQEFGVKLPVVRVFELRTLKNVTGALFGDAAAPDPGTDELHRSALDRLTTNHNQLRAWNTCIAGQPAHFGAAFEIRMPVSFDEIVAATAALPEIHPVLRWRFDENADLSDQEPGRPLACLHRLEPGHDARARLHMQLESGDGAFAIDAFERSGSVREIAVRARSDLLDGASVQQIFSAILANIGRDGERQTLVARYPSRHEWRKSAAVTRPALAGESGDMPEYPTQASFVTTKFDLGREETARLERLGHAWGVTTPALLMGALAAQAQQEDRVVHVDCATDGRLRQGDPAFFPIGPHSEELRFRFIRTELEDVRAYAECAADQLMNALRQGPADIAERALRPAAIAFSYRFVAGAEHGRFRHEVQANHSFAPDWHRIKLSCFRGANGLRMVLRAADRPGPAIDLQAVLRDLLA